MASSKRIEEDAGGLWFHHVDTRTSIEVTPNLDGRGFTIGWNQDVAEPRKDPVILHPAEVGKLYEWMKKQFNFDSEPAALFIKSPIPFEKMEAHAIAERDLGRVETAGVVQLLSLSQSTKGLYIYGNPTAFSCKREVGESAYENGAFAYLNSDEVIELRDLLNAHIPVEGASKDVPTSTPELIPQVPDEVMEAHAKKCEVARMNIGGSPYFLSLTQRGGLSIYGNPRPVDMSSGMVAYMWSSEVEELRQMLNEHVPKDEPKLPDGKLTFKDCPGVSVHFIRPSSAKDREGLSFRDSSNEFFSLSMKQAEELRHWLNQHAEYATHIAKTAPKWERIVRVDQPGRYLEHIVFPHGEADVQFLPEGDNAGQFEAQAQSGTWKWNSGYTQSLARAKELAEEWLREKAK